MSNRQGWVGAVALTTLLVIAGCGQGATSNATLEVASVPAAEIYVDGESRGTSPATLSLSEGDHRIELRTEKFASFEAAVTLAGGESKRIDAALTALDPSDPVVIAKLADAQGVDVAEFVAPEITRGRSGKRVSAILLWPSKDVRKNGLVNYAIEADETYSGDATLEFRHGRKVLYREAFSPETVTTVRTMPAEVLEHVKIGSKITWGLYYEDNRKPIKTSFRVVNRPKAERQLAKMERSRHMKRQPALTKDCMRATILENNRLYTEALVMNLQIAANYPQSSQPYRGIVTTLRRLDGKNSELWSFVAPNVGGKGGHAGGVSVRSAAADMGITAWLPQADPSYGAPTADGSATAKPMTPGGAGVAPPEQNNETTPSGDPAAPSQPGETVPVPAERSPDAAAMDQAAAELEREAQNAQSEADSARDTAAEVAAAAEQAEQAARDAEAAATTAREAVESATDPTREQQEAMARTGAAAEEAREAAEAARQTAAEAAQAARERAETAERTAQAVADMRERAAAASGQVPGASERVPADEGRDAGAQNQDVDAAARAVEQTTSAWNQARHQLEAAEGVHNSNPTDETRQALEAATAAVEEAAKAAYEAQQELEAAEARR